MKVHSFFFRITLKWENPKPLLSAKGKLRRRDRPFGIFQVLSWISLVRRQGQRISSAEGGSIQADTVVPFRPRLSGALLILAGLWLVAVEPSFVGTLVLAGGLVGFGLFNLVSGFRKNLTLSRANQLSLFGNLVLAISLYFVVSRLIEVSYTTDTVVGTY